MMVCEVLRIRAPQLYSTGLIAGRVWLRTMLQRKFREPASRRTKKRRTKELILTAHVLLSKKRYDEALEYLDTAKDETDEFTNFSSNEKMSLLRSQTMITIKNLQSYVYERQGNYDKAIFCLDESVALTSEIYGAASEQYAKVLATQGFLFAKMQKGDKAITNFKRSTSIYVSCQGTVNYEDYIKSLDTMISIVANRSHSLQ